MFPLTNVPQMNFVLCCQSPVKPFLVERWKDGVPTDAEHQRVQDFGLSSTSVSLGSQGGGRRMES